MEPTVRPDPFGNMGFHPPSAIRQHDAVGGNEVGTPQGYPVPLRLSRDDDAKTAIPTGPLRRQLARERLGY
jgi:hypothetical protein